MEPNTTEYVIPQRQLSKVVRGSYLSQSGAYYTQHSLRNVTYVALCLRQYDIVICHSSSQSSSVNTFSLHTPLIIPLLVPSLPHIWPTPWLIASLVKVVFLLSLLKVNVAITQYESTISFINYFHCHYIFNECVRFK